MKIVQYRGQKRCSQAFINHIQHNSLLNRFIIMILQNAIQFVVTLFIKYVDSLRYGRGISKYLFAAKGEAIFIECNPRMS